MSGCRGRGAWLAAWPVVLEGDRWCCEGWMVCRCWMTARVGDWRRECYRFCLGGVWRCC